MSTIPARSKPAELEVVINGFFAEFLWFSALPQPKSLPGEPWDSSMAASRSLSTLHVEAPAGIAGIMSNFRS